STRRTRAVVSTSPVNISPLGEARAYQHVFVDLLHGRRDRAACVVDQLHALAVECPPSAGPACEHRREEHPRLVDLAGVEERAGARERITVTGVSSLAEVTRVEWIGSRPSASNTTRLGWR